MDGSALFLAARALYEGRQLDYHALVDLLTSRIPGLRPAGSPGLQSRWVMWTSASPQNAGQIRFLEFAEAELHWEVRRFNPSDSLTVEPAAVLSLSPDTRARFVRFDASIAFAIGRLAEDHRIVVLSDSFALAQPLLLTARLAASAGRPESRPVLAFFARGLDSRWQGILGKEQGEAPQLVDLDDFEEQLFGASTQGVRGRTADPNVKVF